MTQKSPPWLMKTDKDQVYLKTYLSLEDWSYPPPSLVFNVNGNPTWWKPFSGSISDITPESEIIHFWLLQDWPLLG